MTGPRASGVTTLIYQGADFKAIFTCTEYDENTVACWWPYGEFGLMGVIGRLRFNIAQPLVLTAIAGTPAAASPATLTSSKALLSGGYPTKLLFGPTLRKLPISLDLFPTLIDGEVGWFSTT